MPCKIELSDGRVFDESEFYSWLLDGGYDDLIKNNIIAKRTGEPTKPKGEMRKSGFQERSIERGMEGFVQEVSRNNDIAYEANNQAEQLAKAKEKFGSYELYLENKADLRIGEIVTDPQIQVDRQVALFYISLEGDLRRAEGRSIDTLADEAAELMNTIAKTATMGGQMAAATVWRYMTPGMAGVILNREIRKANQRILESKKKSDKAEIEALESKISELEKLINEQKAETKKRNAKKKAELVNEIVADVDSETLGMITKGVRKDASEAVKKKVNNFFDKLLANENGPVMATVVPITPKMYNAFVNLVRKAVLSGIDLGTALNNASAELIRNKEVTPAEATELRKKLRETMASMKEKKAPTEAQIKRKESAEKLKEATKEFNEEEKLVKETIQDVKTQLGKSKSAIGKDLTIEDFVDELIQEYESMDPMDKTTNQRLIDLVKSKLDVSDSTARTIATKIMKGIVKTKRALDIEAEAKVKEKIEKDFSKLYGTSPIPGARKREVKKDFDKIVDGIENGVLNNSFYRGLFLQKFGLNPELTPTQIFELERLQRIVTSLPPGSRLYNQAVIDMAKYIEELYPPDFMAELVDSIVALNYVQQLANLFPQLVNIVSTGMSIIQSPLANLVNFNKWVKAARKGLKSMDFETFIAYSPLNQLKYIPLGYAQGVKVGSEYFMDVMTNGQINEKYVEGLKSQAGKIKVGRLERNKYGKGLAYYPIKLFGREINPYNYAKYVPRFLNASDMFFFGTDYTSTVMSYAARKAAINNLKGKELENYVRGAIREAFGKVEEAKAQLAQEIKLYELSGKKLDEHIKKVRLSEIITDNLLKQFNVTQEEKVDIVNLSRGRTFTSGIRRGTISQVAILLNKIINYDRSTQVLLKPYIMYVNVIAELAENSLDHMPVYGHLRRIGGTPSSWLINPLVKRFTGKDIGTAKLGEKGTMSDEEQASRAWYGTIVFSVAVMMFGGTDEDDELQLTGGYAGERKKRKFGREYEQMPAYAIRYKDNIIVYKDIPGLNLLFGALGNYNDALQYSKYSPDDLSKRHLLAVLYSVQHTAAMIKDMTYMSALNSFLSDLTDASSAEVNKLEKMSKAVLQKYLGFALKPLPQNNAMLLSIEGMFTHTAYSRREYDDILIYSAGLQHFMGRPSIDIFGEEVQSFPSSGTWPYAHWFDLFEKRPYLGFSLKYNALQPKILNQVVKVYDNEKGDFVERDMSGDEFVEFCKLAGKKYKEKVLLYMAKTDADERVKDVLDEKNGVDYDLNKLFTEAKEEAKREMFITPYVNKKSVEVLDELRNIKKKRSQISKDNREKVINKLKERIEFSSDDESVSEVLKDAGEDKALILLHVANKKGYNTFESVKEYAKRFRKAGILSDDDMGEIIRVARAYEN